MANLDKENRKRLKEERNKITKELVDSDLDNESYNAELNKIKKIDEIIKGEEKPRMGDQSKAAVWRGLLMAGCTIGIVAYEAFGNVIHEKLVRTMATKI